MFLLFKFFNKDNINILFHYYFSILGAYIIGCMLYNRFLNITPLYFESKKIVVNIPAIKFISDKSAPIDRLFILCFLLGSVIGVGYFLTKHYMLNNILGICFCIFGIENLMLGQFKVGFILLGLLFFYDIFWVFGTPVMVSVATNLEGPIKLMFPKKLDWEVAKDFNMIGLGDIVIPGVFVALMMRFDYLRMVRKIRSEIQHSYKNVEKDSKGNYITNFGLKSYCHFLCTVFGYVAGIVATLIVMNYFQKAQPALLYLVPGCLLYSIIPAILTGNIKELWNFDEELSLEETGIKIPPKKD